MNVAKYFTWLTSSFGYIKQFVIDFVEDFQSLGSGLKNFKRNNIKLLEYHLSNGNVFDVRFRLFILKKIKVKDAEIDYISAIFSLLEGNLSAAQQKLNAVTGSYITPLKKFIDGEKNYIPYWLRNHYREYSYAWEDHPKWLYYQIMPEAVTNRVCQYFKTLPDDCNILELGMVEGDFGSYLAKRIIGKHYLTGVEESKLIIGSVSDERKDNQFGYQKKINCDIEKYIDEYQGDLLDLIISIHSINFVADLNKNLVHIKSMLKKNGHLILSLDIADSTFYNNKKNEFTYSIENLTEQFKVAGLNILDITKIDMDKNNQAAIIICSK